MQHVDAGDLHHQFCGEVLRGAVSDLANVILPGLAFARSISSLTFFAGKSGRATIAKFPVATCPTGSNEASVSYGNDLVMTPTMICALLTR